MLSLHGKVIEMQETQEHGDKGFRKRIMAIETGGQYPQQFGISLHNDDCDRPIEVGDHIEFEFDLRGRAWTNPKKPGAETQYFVDLVLTHVTGGAKSESQEQQNPF